jgi:hypothetical protein
MIGAVLFSTYRMGLAGYRQFIQKGVIPVIISIKSSPDPGIITVYQLLIEFLIEKGNPLCGLSIPYHSCS